MFGQGVFLNTFFQKKHLYKFPKAQTESNDSACLHCCSFTGKEKDSETGFYYFGARYYDPVLSGLFISIDPMSDKYPSISPYAYCAWNPIKLVDPDGRMIDDYYNLKGNLVYKTESGDNKHLILTDESKIDNPDNYLSVAVPSMKTLSKMESIYDNVEKNEQGIVLGTDGNSSSIVNGNWDEITPQQWEPALKEIKNVDCLIHLHTADYENCKIGSADPSDKDLNEKNFFNSSKTGIILSKNRTEFNNSAYRTICNPNDYENYISFYIQGKNTSIKGMPFNRFKKIIKKIHGL